LTLLSYLVNVQIFHDSVKNVYRILSIDSPKILINTIVTSRMSFTKTSQKFCQWVDSRANQVYGLGFATENELIRVNLSVFRTHFYIFIKLNRIVHGEISRSKRCNTSSIETCRISK